MLRIVFRDGKIGRVDADGFVKERGDFRFYEGEEDHVVLTVPEDVVQYIEEGDRLEV